MWFLKVYIHHVSDTDSYILGLAEEDLEKCEKTNLSISEKRQLRKVLFGFSDAPRSYSTMPTRFMMAKNQRISGKPLSGTLKVEGQFTEVFNHL